MKRIFTHPLLEVVRADPGGLEGGDAVLRPRQPPAQPEEEAGDLVDLLHVQVELDALVALGHAVHLVRDGQAELLVEGHLLLQAELLGAQHVQLLADADEELVLKWRTWSVS